MCIKKVEGLVLTFYMVQLIFFLFEGECGGGIFSPSFVLSPHCVMYGDGRDLITDQEWP